MSASSSAILVALFAPEFAAEVLDGRRVFRVGHLDGDWLDPRLVFVQVREFGADGAILVRPDRVVAWRAMGGAESPDTEIGAALDQVLARRS